MHHAPYVRRAAIIVGLAAAILPAAARAEIIELGGLDSADDTVVPSCPTDPCRAITRTTAYQRKIDGESDTFTVTKEGRVVAWTISLGEPNTKQAAFFADSYGGDPKAGITVLRQSTKKETKGQSTVLSKTGYKQLKYYYGQTVQFPLTTALKVREGDRVALTVPTWAPALAVNQATSTVWRASRDEDSCTDFSAATMLEDVGDTTAWGCTYRTERLMYGVTIVTAPVPNKDSGGKTKPKT